MIREFGQRAGRQLFQHALQPFGDKLAGTINIRAILELKRHLRQAELRDGTHLLDARQSGEFAFDGLRDELFRFLGRKRRDFRVHLDLNAGDVRHGVNRQMQRRPQARAKQRDSTKQNERALAQGKLESAINHGVKGSRYYPPSFELH